MASKKTAFLKTGKDTEIELLIKKRGPLVHSTFRLSQGAHNAIKQLTDSLGVKNAELFDRLLIFFEGLEKTKNPVPLTEANRKSESIRKTYVVKKETLSKLNKIVSAKNTTRDLLIESAALAFKYILEEVLSDKKARYRNIFEKTITPFLSRAEDIEELVGELGSDDPIVRRFTSVVTILNNLYLAIEHFLKDGTPIDPEDWSQQ